MSNWTIFLHNFNVVTNLLGQPPPGDSTPPPGGPTECYEWDCEAFAVRLSSLGLDVFDFRNQFTSESSIVMPESGYFGSFDGSGGSLYFYAGYAGVTLDIEDGLDSYYAWLVSGKTGLPSLCSDYYVALGLGENVMATGVGSKLWCADNPGVCFMHHGGFSFTSHGTVYFSRKITWKMAGDSESYIQAGISDDTYNNFEDEATNYIGPQTDWVSGTNFTYFSIVAGTPHLEPNGVGGYAWFLPITHTVAINGAEYFHTRQQQMCTYSASPPNVEYVSHGTYVYMFSGIRGKLFAVGVNISAIDIDTLYTIYQENFDTYVQPGYCPVPPLVW